MIDTLRMVVFFNTIHPPSHRLQAQGYAIGGRLKNLNSVDDDVMDEQTSKMRLLLTIEAGGSGAQTQYEVSPKYSLAPDRQHHHSPHHY